MYRTLYLNIAQRSDYCQKNNKQPCARQGPGKVQAEGLWTEISDHGMTKPRIRANSQDLVCLGEGCDWANILSNRAREISFVLFVHAHRGGLMGSRL